MSDFPSIWLFMNMDIWTGFGARYRSIPGQLGTVRGTVRVHARVSPACTVDPAALDPRELKWQLLVSLRCNRGRTRRCARWRKHV